eukprot:symbB.v1.2.028473.t1/scaffold3006.1/size65522/6
MGGEACSGDGGSPVVEYEVRVALSGDLTILAQLCVEGREVKLAGLEPGCSYCAQLRARNGRGWSAWSHWSAPRSPTAVPGRPAPPRPLLQRTTRALLVEWDPPESDTQLLEYEVWCGKEESFCHGIAPADGRRTRTSRTVAKVSGLAPSSDYVFRVRALNLSGWSPWSAPSEAARTGAQSSDEIMSTVYRHFGGSVAAAFRAFDRDRDGLVSKDEFMLALSKPRIGASVEQRSRLFDMVCAEAAGFLSYTDFASLFCSGRAAQSKSRRTDLETKSCRSPGRERQSALRQRQVSPSTSHCLRERALQTSSVETLGCGKTSFCNSRASSPANLRKRDIRQSMSDTESEEFRESACDFAGRCHSTRPRTPLPITNRRVRALSMD